MHGTSSDHRLAAHEAEALWRSWSVNHDKSARDRLVLAYSPMVNYIASRKVRELPPHCELDDLVSYGLVALIEAVDRFDPAKGASFEQYAWTRVAGALMDELRRQDWASRSVRRRARQIEQERDAFYGREGVMPDDVQLANAMAIDIDELRMVLSEAGRAELVSLHAPARTTDEPATVEVIDTIASSSVDGDPQASLLGGERLGALRAAIASLSERERDVLALVHVHELPGAEIGRMLEVSESRVSQILSGVREKLRNELASYEAAAVR